ncbi:MAG: hypothetical protein M1131_07835 [Actinobacteria bacterium]|jgi:hypothetical protein|nr:hypothetical protein [Actinomycetota bacterium]
MGMTNLKRGARFLTKTRTRLALLGGGALGYYLGTRAGRERYYQINAFLHRLPRVNALKIGLSKTTALMQLSREAKRSLSERIRGKSPRS